MKNFCIISNPDKDQGLALSEKIRDYLTGKGASCMVWQSERKIGGEYNYTDPSVVPKNAECVLVLGGDGTLLQAARDLIHVDVPLLGINMGNLGFLAEVNRDAVIPALDQLLEDRYEVEDRMMLSGTIYREDEIIGRDTALNDVVISREGHLRVIGFKNYVNGEYLNSYNADGIIISTPTGSTGYSLSAGGPVVSPNARLMIMTPVAPHTLNTRSVILPEEDVVTVEIGKGRRKEIEQATASFDGDMNYPMITGDRIVIRRAADRTRILKLNHMSFVETLRKKLQ